MKIEIKEIAFHRNGCTGEGFHTVKFSTSDEPLLIAILFEKTGYIAVHSVAQLAKGKIGVENSWRGDEFEKQLRLAIRLDLLYPTP